MARSLNFERIQKRMVREVSSKEALKDVTPFDFGTEKNNRNIKIVVGDVNDSCVNKET